MSTMKRRVTFLLLLLLPWFSVVAVEGPSPAQPLFSDAEWTHAQAQGHAPGQSGTTDVASRAAFGLLLSVGLIIGVAVILAFAAKRWGMRRILPGRGRHMEVIETVPLAFKRSVSLVRIGDQLLVVGQGEHELHHLALLPANVLEHSGRQTTTPTTTDQLQPPADTPPATSSAFAATLSRLMGKRP
jgi:flagellar biogenesis protein FliO